MAEIKTLLYFDPHQKAEKILIKKDKKFTSEKIVKTPKIEVSALSAELVAAAGF